MMAKVDPAQSAEQSKSEPYIELVCTIVCNKNIKELTKRILRLEQQRTTKTNNVHQCFLYLGHIVDIWQVSYHIGTKLSYEMKCARVQTTH